MHTIDAHKDRAPQAGAANVGALRRSAATPGIDPSQVAMLCKGSEVYGIGTILKLYADGCPGMLFVCMGEGALSEWLRARGNRVMVVAGITRLGLGRGVRRLHFGGAVRRARRTARALEPLLATHGIRVVQAHWYAHWLVAGFLRRRGYRSVWQINNFRNPGPFPRLRRAVHNALARWGADLLLPASDFIAREWGGSRVPTVTVRNAAVPRLEGPVPLPAPPLRCVAAGRIIPQKGHHIAVEAVLAARAQGADVRLDIIGGPVEGSAYADSLRALISGSDDPSAIRLCGFEPRLRDRHQGYHVALQCRLDPEPCSLWVCEALVDGLVVVGSATGGTPELVRDGETGLLYPPGDVHRLASQLVELAASPERLREMRIRAFADANENLTLKRFVDQSFAAYSRMTPPDERQ